MKSSWLDQQNWLHRSICYSYGSNMQCQCCNPLKCWSLGPRVLYNYSVGVLGPAFGGLCMLLVWTVWYHFGLSLSLFQVTEPWISNIFAISCYLGKITGKMLCSFMVSMHCLSMHFHVEMFHGSELKYYKCLITVRSDVMLELDKSYDNFPIFDYVTAPKSRLQNRLAFHLSHKFGDERKLMSYHQNLQDIMEDQLTLASIHYLRSHYQEAIDIYKRILLDNRSGCFFDSLVPSVKWSCVKKVVVG